MAFPVIFDFLCALTHLCKYDLVCREAFKDKNALHFLIESQITLIEGSFYPITVDPLKQKLHITGLQDWIRTAKVATIVSGIFLM